MMQKIKYIVMFLSVVLFTQCEVEHKDFNPSNGDANFTMYVAIGDSYSAGYTDGALGRRGQDSSFPNIIARQLAYVGNDKFTQLLVKSEGSIGIGGIGYFDLKIVGQSLTPVPGIGDMSIFTEKVYSTAAPINNLGVPGAKASDLINISSSIKPFFGRFSSSSNSSILSDALAQNPTFVSLWIGGNDVLGYALSGGEVGAPTQLGLFESDMKTIANQLFSPKTKGVIANIPDIEALPYFSAIPYDALEIDQITADSLNVGYSQYNAASVALGLPKIYFIKGKNALVIKDKNSDHPGKMRQIKNGEKVLLPALGYIKNKDAGWGSKVAIAEEYVLSTEEVNEIKKATVSYNQTIRAIANKYGLAFVDLNALMTKGSAVGIMVDGNKYSSTFVSGGLFSLDGVHATARGSAIIANEFIKAINKQYDAQIPLANINDYNTVTYP